MPRSHRHRGRAGGALWRAAWRGGRRQPRRRGVPRCRSPRPRPRNPTKTLTNSNPKKIHEMEENQSVRMEELPLRIGFPSFSLRIGWEDGVDLEGKREGRRHGGWSSGGKKNGRSRKRRLAEWACIRLSRATAHGATESRQSMWHDSAFPRQARCNACASVAARSRRSMWCDSSGSRTTGLGAAKKASFWKFRSVQVIIKILD